MGRELREDVDAAALGRRAISLAARNTSSSISHVVRTSGDSASDTASLLRKLGKINAGADAVFRRFPQNVLRREQVLGHQPK